MFGGFGFAQQYFAGGPLTVSGGATTTVGDPPIRIRRVTSGNPNAAQLTNGTGDLRRKTSGRGTLMNVEQSE